MSCYLTVCGLLDRVGEGCLQTQRRTQTGRSVQQFAAVRVKAHAGVHLPWRKLLVWACNAALSHQHHTFLLLGVVPRDTYFCDAMVGTLPAAGVASVHD
jgi:hypothetical protein